jgi:hypothetical protein
VSSRTLGSGRAALAALAAGMIALIPAAPALAATGGAYSGFTVASAAARTPSAAARAPSASVLTAPPRPAARPGPPLPIAGIDWDAVVSVGSGLIIAGLALLLAVTRRRPVR